jgi:hypothetical protein
MNMHAAPKVGMQDDPIEISSTEDGEARSASVMSFACADTSEVHVIFAAQLEHRDNQAATAAFQSDEMQSCPKELVGLGFIPIHQMLV